MKRVFCIPLLTLLMMDGSLAQEQAVDRITWKKAAALPVPENANVQPGIAGPLTGVDHDMLIVGGGANFPNGMPWLGGQKVYHNDVYVFKIEANGVLKDQGKRFKLPFSTAYGASCSTSKGIIYAGGEDKAGISHKVLLVRWDKATESLLVEDLPRLPVGIANASITSSGSQVFIAGGETKDAVSSGFYMLDLEDLQEGWRQYPDLPRPVSHAVMVFNTTHSGESLFIIGGRKKNVGGVSDLYASVYRFDFHSGGWSERKSLPYALSAGTGVSSGNGKILMFGGDRGGTFSKTEKLIQAIGQEKDQSQKAKLVREKAALQSDHPGFSKDVLSYDIFKNDWSVLGSIPFESPVTTTAIRTGCFVIIPSGEIKAGVRSPQILVAELK